MDGTLIATTRNAELQALGTGGQLAVQAWDQITGYLRRSRGEAHAALFAEPNPDPDRGVTDWYAEGGGTAGPPLDSLPPEEREAARAEFTRLYEDVRAESEALRRSARENERFLGELLALALTVPSADSLRVLGRQPVLVAWAHSAIGAPPAPELLLGQLARRPVGVTGAGGPMRILGPPAPLRLRRPWATWAAAAAVLLLVTLLPALLWADPFRWFEAEPPQCALGPEGVALLDDLRAEEAREGLLRTEIARLNLALGDRRVACPPPPPVAGEPRRAAPSAVQPVQARGADAERARRQAPRSSAFRVTLRQEGLPDRVFTGSAAPGPAAQVGTFDVPAR